MYYFEIYEFDLIGCWECEAICWDEAITKYIEVLKDPKICEDDFDLNRHLAIIKKLQGYNYEIDEETNTLYIQFTREELAAL